MRRVVMEIIVLLLVLLGVYGALSQTPVPTWQFVADRPVAIHSGRGLSYPVGRMLQPGEIVDIQPPYVQKDDLIWAQMYPDTGQWVALARYGVCEIRSFGTYQPPDKGPKSVYP